MDMKATGEGSLDIQFLMGMAPNISTWYVYLPNGPNQDTDPFLEWVILLMLLPNPPHINSISYGDDEYSLSSRYMLRTGDEFLRFTSSGHTLFFSSGDYGVACHDNQFVAHFPSSCPYVTSVGGTVIFTDPDTGKPVTAEEGISFSGGGFSFTFPQPSFQVRTPRPIRYSPKKNLSLSLPMSLFSINVPSSLSEFWGWLLLGELSST